MEDSSFLQNLIKRIPTLDKDIWDAIQKKSFVGADDAFLKIADLFTEEDWEYIDWNAIFDGSEMVRGKLSEEEWDGWIFPVVAKILLNFGIESSIGCVYKNLSEKNLRKIHNHFISLIPGKQFLEKTVWLKENKAFFFVFLLATPAQEIGVCIPKEKSVFILSEKHKRYSILPFWIKDVVFSYELAKRVFFIGHTFNLTEEKISILGILVGGIFLGNASRSELCNEIEKKLSLSHETALQLVDELQKKVFSFYSDEVDFVESQFKNSLVGLGSLEEKNKISLEQSPDEEVFSPAKIQVSGDTDLSSKKIPVTDEPAPLVIHREKPRETQEKGSSQQARGFSMPFGFFKQKTIRTEPAQAPVKATIEFFKKDEPKRAVDYNELRTPLTPFAKEEGFIQTEKNQNTSAPKEGVVSQIQKKSEDLNIKTGPEKELKNIQPPIQKINPLLIFDKQRTTPMPNGLRPKPQVVSEQKTSEGVGEKKGEASPIKTSGVLDIRGIKVDQKTPTTSPISAQTQNNKGGDSEIKNEGWGFFRKKQNTNNAPKQEVKIEAQKTSITSQQTQNENKKSDTQKTPQITNTVVQNKAEHTKNGAGFVWFKKPEQKEQKMTKTNDNNDTEKNPKIEGNIIDLRQTYNKND